MIRVDCGVKQYSQEDRDGGGFTGRPVVLVPAETFAGISARYEKGEVTVNAGGRIHRVKHELMGVQE